MLIAAVVLAAAVGAVILFFQLRGRRAVAAVLSPLTYLVILWLMAFPIRAVLISSGTVPTQVIGFWGDPVLALSLVVSTVALAVIAAGFWSSSWSGRRTPPSDAAVPLVDVSLPPPDQVRPALVIAATAAASIAVFAVRSFENGNFVLFRQNAMLETRVGEGWVSVVSEVASFGLVALLTLFALKGFRGGSRIVAVALVLLHLAAAVAIAVGLSSRRPLATVLLGAAVVVFMKVRRFAGLAAVMLVGTVLLAPVLDAVRNTCLPCLFYDDVTTVDPVVGSSRLASDAVFLELLLLYDEVAPQQVLTAVQATRAQDLQRRRSEAAALPGADAPRAPLERELRSARPGAPSAAQTELLRLLGGGASSEPSPAPTPPRESRAEYERRLFITSASSSFEGAEHLASYFQRTSMLQVATGVDHGRAWIFNAGVALVPRDLWRGKPLVYGSNAEQRFLYPYMFEGTAGSTTIPVGLPVDLFFAFGVPIGLVVAFGLGRILAAVEWDLWNAADPARRGLAIFVFLNMFNLVRGGTGLLQSVLLQLIVLGLAFGFRQALAAAVSLLQRCIWTRQPALDGSTR